MLYSSAMSTGGSGGNSGPRVPVGAAAATTSFAVSTHHCWVHGAVVVDHHVEIPAGKLQGRHALSLIFSGIYNLQLYPLQLFLCQQFHQLKLVDFLLQLRTEKSCDSK